MEMGSEFRDDVLQRLNAPLSKPKDASNGKAKDGKTGASVARPLKRDLEEEASEFSPCLSVSLR